MLLIFRNSFEVNHQLFNLNKIFFYQVIFLISKYNQYKLTIMNTHQILTKNNNLKQKQTKPRFSYRHNPRNPYKYDIRDRSQSYSSSSNVKRQSSSSEKIKNYSRSRQQNNLQFSPYQHKQDSQVTFNNVSFQELGSKRNRNREQTAHFSPYSQKKSQKKIKQRSPYPDKTYLDISKPLKDVTMYQNNNSSRSKDANIRLLQNRNRNQKSFYLEKQNDIRIMEDLIKNNKYLTQQNILYKEYIHKLEGQINVKDTKLKILGQQIQKRLIEQNMKHQQIIAQMKNQIRAVLDKNDILNRRLQQMTYLNPIQSIGSRLSLQKKITQKQDQYKNTIQQLIEYVSRQYFQKIVQDKDPGKIKYSPRQIKKAIQIIIKRNIKLESFANRFIQMRTKAIKNQIQGENSEQDNRDLKKCWKWMKSIVQECIIYRNFLKQAKNILQIQNKDENNALNQILKCLKSN